MIHIYADAHYNETYDIGCCGFVILSDIHKISDKNPKVNSSFYLETTINRVKLLSIISALNNIKNLNNDIIIYTNLKLIVSNVTNLSNIENFANKDIWYIFLELYNKQNIKVVWLSKKDSSIENKNHLKYLLKAENLALKEFKNYQLNFKKIICKNN